MILGLGTGHCGTRSLAALLGLPHEKYRLPWKRDEKRLDRIWEDLMKDGGDVGLQWLPYVEMVLERAPDTRFLCLQRDREDTLRGFGVAEYNDPLGEIEGRIPIGDYYDRYYYEAMRLRVAHPERFRIFPMEQVLNFEPYQSEMLSWCGAVTEVRLGVHEGLRSEVERVTRKALSENFLQSVLHREPHEEETARLLAFVEALGGDPEDPKGLLRIVA